MTNIQQSEVVLKNKKIHLEIAKYSLVFLNKLELLNNNLVCIIKHICIK